jgi:hypothetical protein
LDGLLEQLERLAQAEQAVVVEPTKRYEQLFRLRDLVFTAPLSLLLKQGRSLETLVVVAYFYATALVTTPPSPDLSSPVYPAPMLLILDNTLKEIRETTVGDVKSPFTGRLRFLEGIFRSYKESTRTASSSRAQ